MLEAECFIKVKGADKPYGAINLVKSEGWIDFDRINTKSGEMVGHFSIAAAQVESIEVRKPKLEESER